MLALEAAFLAARIRRVGDPARAELLARNLDTVLAALDAVAGAR